MKTLYEFINDESGAVTVDWVVLAAAMVLIVIGVANVLRPQISTAVGNVGTALINTTTQAKTTAIVDF